MKKQPEKPQELDWTSILEKALKENMEEIEKGMEPDTEKIHKALCYGIRENGSILVVKKAKKKSGKQSGYKLYCEKVDNLEKCILAFTSLEAVPEELQKEAFRINLNDLIVQAINENQYDGISFIVSENQKVALCEAELYVILSNNIMTVAIQYATIKQFGNLFAKSPHPNIMHCFDVMNTLREMDFPPNLIIAGILHDILENTDASEAEIKQMFGSNVARIVVEYNKKKGSTKKEQMEFELKKLERNNAEYKALFTADHVSLLKMYQYVWEQVGENIEEIFSVSLEELAWFYRNAVEHLAELPEYEETGDLYLKMEDLVNTIFCRYYYDGEYMQLYKEYLDGKLFYLNHVNCNYEPAKNKLPHRIEEIPYAHALEFETDVMRGFLEAAYGPGYYEQMKPDEKEEQIAEIIQFPSKNLH